MAGEPAYRGGLLCDRAREWTSLSLDGELSEMERALLARHLAGCPSCREFDLVLREATERLRATPLERPARTFEPPRRALPFPARRRVALVAVAAAAALGSLVGALADRPSGPAPSRLAPEVSFMTRDVHQLREIPRGQTFSPTPPPRQPGAPPEGIV
jgi:ferric-dicitrate binding protein FerR (iron transport regulator)